MSDLSITLLTLAALLAAPAALCLLYPPFLYLAPRFAPNRSDAVSERESRTVVPASSVALVTVTGRRDARLERKLEGLTRLAEHPAVTEVLIGLDGDSSPMPAHTPFRWIAVEERRGKNGVLRKIHAAARADILVFTDVDAEVEPLALEALLAPFADGGVGAVTGKRSIIDDTPFGHGQRRYTDLDSLIRRLEMRCLGSVTSCDGKLYAIRRSCVDRSLPDDVTDDLYTGLGAIACGRRLVSQPNALARVGRPARDVAHELERRRRVTCRGLSTLWHRRSILNPWRHGGYALALLVNKLLRRLAGPGLVLAVVAFISALLALPGHPDGSVLRPALLALVTAGPIAFALLQLSRGRGGSLGYLVLGMLGMTLGVVDYLRGKRVRSWESRKPDDQEWLRTSDDRPALDYLVSHYPKLTETFVIDEVIGLERSFDVTVHPISPGDSAEQHPTAVPPAQTIVREHPLSGGILRDACLRAAGSPRALVEPLAAILGAAPRDPRVACKSLVLLPKALALGYRMRRRPVDHLHAGFANYSATMAWMVARSTGLPFSFVAHANDIFKTTFLLDEKVRDAAAVFAISQYNKDYLLRVCPRASADRIHVLPTGVDLGRYAFRVRPRPEPVWRLLSIGSLLEKKGHAVLCEALAALRASGHDIRCRIVGEGPGRAALEQHISRLGLADAVELLGEQPRERVRELLDESDLFALSCVEASDRSADGIPVALMEAMASGLPVVTTRLRAIPELVSDNISGLLCEPGSSEELAHCIERLLEDDTLRRTLANGARERIEKAFDQRQISLTRCAIISAAIGAGPASDLLPVASGFGGEH